MHGIHGIPPPDVCYDKIRKNGNEPRISGAFLLKKRTKEEMRMGYNFMGLRKNIAEKTEQKPPAPDVTGGSGVESQPDGAAGTAMQPAGKASDWDFAEFLSSNRKGVKDYELSMLDDNKENHFSRMSGDKWEEFVGSIRQYGIVTPLIIRRKGDRYEIIAGHNRKYGALEAGLTKVPCILTDLDDVDASVLIGITNQQREQTTDLEWGWTYRTTLEAIKHQGKEETNPNAEESSPGERSIDIVARKYGVNRKTAQRKIRLTYLVPGLYKACQEHGYSQAMLVELSYLHAAEQEAVAGLLEKKQIHLCEDTIKRIRARSEEGALAAEEIQAICSSEKEPKAKKTKAIKYSVSEKLFPVDLAFESRPMYIEKALQYIREHEIDPMMEHEKEAGNGTDDDRAVHAGTAGTDPHIG